jgi:hypothetical protein
MVNRAALLVALIAVCIVTASTFEFASAAGTYTINQEWAQIFINQDGTIDLIYNVSITVTSGEITAFDLGQPNQDFTVGQAFDQYGNQLNTYKFNENVASVDFKQPLTAGQSIWWTITTNVGGMIYNDTTNPGNYGMQFIPQWDGSVGINDVRIQIVLPEGVQVGEVKTTEVYYNGTSTVEGKLAVYWQKPAIGANEQFKVGVSFPSQYMPNYVPSATSSPGGFNFESIAVIFGVVAALIAVVVFIFIIYRVSKRSYQKPQVSMETLGVKRGLTAVEASYLLDMKPPQIVTEILYSLLQKRAVWAEATKPSLKLKILPPYENKTGTQENPLRYYEIDFLNALKADGALDEEKLAKTVMFLRDTTEEKLKGYSRKDTVDYYRKIVDQAWKQVEQAGTPDLASNAYNEQLLWLMMDPNQRGKTETIFHDRPFQPQPLWFWWWYGYTIYHPRPTYHPNIGNPAQSGPAPSIPGADFANNIATSLEQTGNNIVVNLEKFANSIVPPPPKANTSHEPAPHKAGCVCACAACACACACVSCACACAGGGGR